MKIQLLLFTILICTVACNTRANNESDDWTFAGFTKIDSSNPILSPDSSATFVCPVREMKLQWESRNVLNPAAIVREGKVFLLFRAQDSAMTSRIGMAVSEDGIHFNRLPEPVFFPAKDSMYSYEWPGGVEDPRIVESEEGLYILTYTAYDGKTARLCMASSKDLIHWTKHGPVLSDAKYLINPFWSKSGAIVCKLTVEKIVATRINGKYWMYFGDTDLFLASSEDLIHWQVVESDEFKTPVAVMHPRPGYFDSRLVEPGPFALLKEQGILLIYNGSNAANYNDDSLPRFTYSAGQALFDRNRPYRLIDRTDSFFIKPDKSYEKVGEVNEVCFVEGLVRFKDKWFLYYGTADSRIAVAFSDSK